MIGPSIQQPFELAQQHRKHGRLAEAIAIYRDLSAKAPNNLPFLLNLGIALKDANQLDEALSVFQKTISLHPSAPQGWGSLGVTWKLKGYLDPAIDALEKAVSLESSSAIALNNLGLAYQDAGRLDDAIHCFECALQFKPNHHVIDSNRLHALHFSDRSDAQSLYREHIAWASRHTAPLNRMHVLENDRSTTRPLKIGYVSPNFRDHVVGRFLLPLFANHDHTRFQIYCYNSQAPVNDAISQRLRSCADAWREIGAQSDEQAAALIREDQIDILVDLTMHMSHQRLLLFALKPAPVQAIYLAYCSTTGLDTIDYRITDPHLDPAEREEHCYSERSIHLPETYWCYEPAVETPEPDSPPAQTPGYVTFGGLNNFCKVTPHTLSVWCDLLKRAPNSRLLLHAHEGAHRQRVLDFLKQQAVDPSRLDFVGFEPLEKYLELYNKIDIALDTFPYAGGTTTCDAVWMGVPVVTLAGRTAVGRGGVSILSNLGLTELIARTPDEYVNIATALSTDLPRLRELRKTLRAKMRHSPLMDAKRFTRNMESAYRTMWDNYCTEKK